MLNYANLSDIEFEYLCQNIMQRKLDVPLRRFTPGKDGGIDLTDNTSDPNIIVQVKHYNSSSIDTLIRALKKEKDKVKLHKPKQYFICCSRALTPENIKELFFHFSEYMPSDKNIITLNEIEDFLQSSENTDILRKHYKLWIDSVGILQELQNTNIFIDCEVLLSNIEKEKCFFVKTQVFEQALKCLEKNKTLFITGNPGVGKTTTSKMLVLHYAALGYRVRFTSNTSDLRELKKSLSQDKNIKEIILVDDCFGQAYFKIRDGQNEDLLSLIKYVNLSPNKLLILNSRITIFQEAKALKPDLVKSMEDNEYTVFILDMNALSDIEKAKIFYNHLFFNETPIAYLDEIKKHQRYLSIIKHQNYNPRLISFICNPNRYKKIGVKDYYTFICQHLRNPHEIWRDEYEEKLLKADRILLTTLHSLTDNTVSITLLKKCFEKRIENEKDIDKTINQFQASLRRLTESFVSIVDEKGTKKIMVVNPSVNDYLDSRMQENPLEKRAIVETAYSIQQFDRLLSKTDFEYFVEDAIKNNRIHLYLFDDEKQKLAFIAYHIGKLNIFNEHYLQLLRLYLTSPSHLYFKGHLYIKAEKIIQALLSKDMLQNYRFDEFIVESKNIKQLLKFCDLDEMIGLINLLSPLFSGKNRADFIEIATNSIQEAIEEFADSIEVDSYVTDPSPAINFAMHEEYFDIDEAVSDIEESAIDSAIDDIEYRIKSLPDDIIIEKDFIQSLCFGVNGAEELIQSYMEDGHYDKEDFDVDSYDSDDEEIDYIFNRKL